MVLGFLFLVQGFSVDLPNPGKPRSEISAELLAIWGRQAVSGHLPSALAGHPVHPGPANVTQKPIVTNSLWDKFKHLFQGLEEDLRSYYKGYHITLKVSMSGILLMVKKCRGWPRTTGSVPDHADLTKEGLMPAAGGHTLIKCSEQN